MCETHNWISHIIYITKGNHKQDYRPYHFLITSLLLPYYFL